MTDTLYEHEGIDQIRSMKDKTHVKQIVYGELGLARPLRRD
jgi:hypothetical protein